jgi:hypothetical protein
MLKLVEIGPCMRDVGFKVDPDIFYVIGVL